MQISRCSISSSSEIGTMSDSESRRQEETPEKGNIHGGGKCQAWVSGTLGCDGVCATGNLMRRPTVLLDVKW